MAQRIDLSDYQPGAWADIRAHRLHGLQRALVKVAQERGVDLQALADADQQAALQLADELQALTLRYQVVAWHILNDDGEPLPDPKTIHAADLDWCDGDLIQALVQAINAREGAALPNPTTPSAASSTANSTPTA